MQNLNRLNSLKQKVEKFYLENKNSVSKDWFDLVYQGHLLIVVKNAEDLAQKYKANFEYCSAGALIHDLAYAVTTKNDPELDSKSEELGRKILKSAEYSSDEIETIIKIVNSHSATHKIPESLEAKIVATADAITHFETLFYSYINWHHLIFKPDGYETFKKWVLKKIDRDFNQKIFFEEEKVRVKKAYDSIKLFYEL
jgi:HD superfamily phosphodiesterase